jgi:multidrug efflux pump subunit AcrB
MTSLAFIGGTLPLVFASGAGANAQHSVGLGIIGGILGSLLLTPLLIPAFLLIVLKFSRKSTP